MDVNVRYIILILGLALTLCVVTAEDKAEEGKVDEKAVEYAKGSICNYCEHCVVSDMSE